MFWKHICKIRAFFFFNICDVPFFVEKFRCLWCSGGAGCSTFRLGRSAFRRCRTFRAGCSARSVFRFSTDPAQWVILIVSAAIFGIAVGVRGYYDIGPECQGFSIAGGLFGLIAGAAGVTSIISNKNGTPIYINLLFYTFVLSSSLSVLVPFSSFISMMTTIAWRVRAAEVSLLIIGLIQASAMVYATLQIRDNAGTRYLNFGGSGGASSSDRAMSGFVNSWNNIEGSCCGLETSTKIKKNLKSEKCLLWSLTLFHLLSGLVIIGLGLFHVFENKMTLVTIFFAPFWAGPVAILCCLIGFIALNRKTIGLGLVFLGSNIITFSIGVTFLVLVCIDVDERIRCIKGQYCGQYLTDTENMTFFLTYAGFGLIVLFQIIFSFVGIILFFATMCSCSRSGDRNSHPDSPPSYIESSSNFDPISERY